MIEGRDFKIQKFTDKDKELHTRKQLTIEQMRKIRSIAGVSHFRTWNNEPEHIRSYKWVLEPGELFDFDTEIKPHIIRILSPSIDERYIFPAMDVIDRALVHAAYPLFVCFAIWLGVKLA
jgi:hypothetical protein